MTVTERVANSLQKDIFAGTFKPGDRLPPERELAEKLNANRNAVREALKRLEQLGLVTTRHGSGTTVKNYLQTGNMETLVGALASAPQSIPATIWRDALDFRVYYVPAIAHLAATRGDAKKAHLLAGQFLELQGAREAMAWARAEAAWMNTLVVASENQMFILMQNTVSNAFKAGTGLSAVLFAHREQIERGYQEVGELVGKKDAPRAMSKMWALMEAERSWLSGLLSAR
jgi:GntR family transcriptional regulator, transcriptional repressor for pyruvate dehydrogenase complex